jgi:hypothetical protein
LLPVFWQDAFKLVAPRSALRRQPIVLEDLNPDLRNGLLCAFSEKRKGQRWQVNAMQKLIEFYEMVSLNDAALRGRERTAILKARLALRMFERAMESFTAISGEAPSAAEQGFRMAA